MQGGVLCPRCGSIPGTQAWPISMTALKYLRHLQRSSYSDALRAEPSEPVRREMESLLQQYLTYLLERRLNTPQFLREVRRTDLLAS